MKFLTLLKSQFQQERRSGEQLILGLTFSIILGALTFLTLASAYLDTYTIQKLLPSLYWILFLFASTLAVGRAFEPDLEFRAIDLVRLSLRGKEHNYFFAKYLFTAALVLLIGSSLLLTIVMFCPVRLPPGTINSIFVVLLLTIPSYSALSVIISAILAQQRLRAILLPCLLFPLLTPVLFAAVELTFSLSGHGAIVETLLNSPWFWILVMTTIAYPLLGSSLFSACLEE